MHFKNVNNILVFPEKLCHIWLRFKNRNIQHKYINLIEINNISIWNNKRTEEHLLIIIIHISWGSLVLWVTNWIKISKKSAKNRKLENVYVIFLLYRLSINYN